MDLHWQSNVSAFKNYIIEKTIWRHLKPLLLLLSHFSRVRLCATPQTAAHQAPPSLRFSRQEYWSGLPFPSQMHESEKWKWSEVTQSCPTLTDPMDCSPLGSSIHGIFQARVLEWGAIAFSVAESSLQQFEAAFLSSDWFYAMIFRHVFSVT